MIDYNILPDNAARNEIIKSICQSYDFVKHSYIGKSVCGRCIDVLHIGNTKNRVLYCGGFHGSEYLTTLTLLKFFEECCQRRRDAANNSGRQFDINNTSSPDRFKAVSDNIENRRDAAHNSGRQFDINNTSSPDRCQAVTNNAENRRYAAHNALNIRGLTIVPCVNPDGVEIALNGSEAAMKYKSLVDKVCKNTYKWQANARGVDINHNFDAGWCTLKQRELSMNIKSPAPTRFGGTHPESEPETRALTTLCRNICFERALALHSQGREIYCAYGKNTPALSFRLASLFSQASGYNIAFPEDIATGGGFKDWFIEKFKRPAITVEMGMGENPLPLSDFESEYEIMQKILHLGIVV